MVSYTQYKDPTDTTRTPSPVIWADCPTLEMLHDPAAGHHIFDDFLHFELNAAGETAYGNYKLSLDTGATLAAVNDTDFGQIEPSALDTADDGLVLMYGFDAGWARFGSGSSDQVWFEARFSTDTITDDECAMFLGFLEVNVNPTADITLANTTNVVNTTEDFVGFLIDPVTDTGGGLILEAIYQEGGQTKVDVGDAITTLVVGTKYKVGMKYKGAAGTSGVGQLEYFVDGAIVQTLNVTSSLNFPDTNHLAMCWALKNRDGGNNKVQLDWWRGAAVGGNT